MREIVIKVLEKILAWAAKRVIAIEKPIIIGVTGSVAKTSTKEAIGYILRKNLTNYEVRLAKGNLNTDLGLPLAILGLEKAEAKTGWMVLVVESIMKGLFYRKGAMKKIFVLEYAADHPGDITNLIKIASPNIAVVTLVGSAHTLYFGSIEKVAKEKSALVKVLSNQGLAILNGNDEQVKMMGQLTRARKIIVNTQGIDLAKDLAIAVAKYGFNIDKKEATETLKNWHPPAGRLNLLVGKKQTWLLDDTYNSNPLSATLALRELKRLGRERKSGRLIAILGDMLELGEEENKVHKGIALLAEKVADLVILVGPRFKVAKIGQWFDSTDQVAEQILSVIKSGDMILVKGSQGMRMEKISAALLADNLDPSKVLVRQSNYWLKKPYIEP